MPPRSKGRLQAVSFRFTPETKALLEELARESNVSQTDILETLIRQRYRRLKRHQRQQRKDDDAAPA